MLIDTEKIPYITPNISITVLENLVIPNYLTIKGAFYNLWLTNLCPSVFFFFLPKFELNGQIRDL